MFRKEKSPSGQAGAADKPAIVRIGLALDYSTERASCQEPGDLADLLGQARDAEVRWMDSRTAGDVAGAARWRRVQFDAQARAWAMGVRP